MGVSNSSMKSFHIGWRGTEKAYEGKPIAFAQTRSSALYRRKGLSPMRIQHNIIRKYENMACSRDANAPDTHDTRSEQGDARRTEDARYTRV